VIHDRPPRLDSRVYFRKYCYHVRVSTWNRERHFENAATTNWALRHFLQQSEPFQFALLAYCFMPDHVHSLLESQSEANSLVGLIGRWKQATGYEFKRQTGVRLWQPSFFDRVLREADSSEAVAAYILGNPIRAGITSTVGAYPYAWCVWGNEVGATRG
jgi:putative transposase